MSGDRMQKAEGREVEIGFRMQEADVSGGRATLLHGSAAEPRRTGTVRPRNAHSEWAGSDPEPGAASRRPYERVFVRA